MRKREILVLLGWSWLDRPYPRAGPLRIQHRGSLVPDGTNIAAGIRLTCSEAV